MAAAFQAAASGRPGAAYVDLPSDVLLTRLPAAVQAGQLVQEKLPAGAGECGGIVLGGAGCEPPGLGLCVVTATAGVQL